MDGEGQGEFLLFAPIQAKEVSIYMKYIHKFEEIFGGVILGVMTIVTFLAAINRFTFNFAMPWSEELVKFLVMWMTMIGAALGIGRNEHVGIDVFVEKFPQKIQFFIGQFMSFVGMAFSVIFCYIGYLMVVKQHTQSSTALEISMGVVYACVVVGAILMLIEFGYKFVNGFKEQKEKRIALGGECK